MAYNLAVRIWTIIVAVISGILITVFLLKPYVFEPLCLINTNQCIQISFRKYKNSVLVHMQPTGYWWWFNGEFIFVFGLPTGRQCEGKNFEPAFVIDTRTAKVKGYECVTHLENLIKFYKDDRKAKEQHIFICMKNKKKNFNIYDAFDQLVLKNIIQVPSGKTPDENVYVAK